MLRRTVLFNIDPLAHRSLKKIVAKVKPDLIHCHNLYFTSLAPVKVAVEKGIPCIVTVHDYWPVCLNQASMKSNLTVCDEKDWRSCASECKYKRYDFIIRLFLNRAMKARRKILTNEGVKLVAVSHYVKAVLERFDYAKKNIHVIHNGVNINTFKPAPQSDEATALFVGYPTRLKGIEDFLKAAEKLNKNLPTAKFIVVGGKLGATSALVENPGKLPHDQLPQYYQKSSCVCVPSLSPEPLPTVALEAMACAKPVIAYAVGGLTEVIEDGKTGFLVKRLDVDMLSNRIQFIFENPDKARKMGLIARKKVEQEYSIERMVRDYERLYQMG